MYMSRSKRNYDQLGKMRTSESTQVLTITPQQQHYRNEWNRLMLFLITTTTITAILISALFVYHQLNYSDQKHINLSDASNRLVNVYESMSNGVKAYVSCEKVKFDYLILAVRWPSAFCYSSNCQEPPILRYQKWELHGLWPNYYDGSYPQFCCPDWPFDIDQIKQIEGELDKYWFNLENNTDKSSLWSHEWTKHGSCCLSSDLVNNEFKYFNETLNLFKSYPLQKWFDKANIIPSNNIKLIDFKNVSDAITNNYPKRFVISCSTYDENGKYQLNMNDSRNSNSLKMLDTIYFCFEPKELTPIDCPMSLNVTRNNNVSGSSCGSNIIYPIFNINNKLP